LTVIDLYLVGLFVLLPLLVLCWMVISVVECAVGSHRDRQRDVRGFDIIPPR
jgi:hypothetical protein